MSCHFSIVFTSTTPLWHIIRIGISINKFHVAIINVSTWYKHLDKRNENISKFPLRKQKSSRFFNLKSKHQRQAIRIKDITNTCAIALFMMFDILLLDAIKNFTFHSPTKKWRVWTCAILQPLILFIHCGKFEEDGFMYSLFSDATINLQRFLSIHGRGKSKAFFIFTFKFNKQARMLEMSTGQKHKHNEGKPGIIASKSPQ